MNELLESKKIFINETEKRPNLYAANVLVGVVLVIAVSCVLNEIGVFYVNKILMRICLGTSFSMFIAVQCIVHFKSWIVKPASKYIIMAMVLLLVLTSTVLLNIHAVLAFVLPLLLAAQYRSHAMSRMALIGSCICCGVAPILAYFLSTWSEVFLTGYIQTFCRVTIDVKQGNDMSTLEALKQITLYWSMPQMLTLCAFGVILFTITKSGIDSVNNQMQVSDLSINLNKQLESIVSMQEKVLYSMSDIIENRDLETGGHVKRTSEIVKLIMDAMKDDPESGITDEFYNDVIRSAPMHDLGKIAIPDQLLRKPGKLTVDEFEIIKLHPEKSAEIIAQVLTGIENERVISTAINIARYHHERMDGTGYPEGLIGKKIPLEARIMAIADVYDALVSERCYKAPMAYDEAFDTIEQSMGTQFDSDLNKYFISCRSEIEEFYRN